MDGSQFGRVMNLDRHEPCLDARKQWQYSTLCHLIVGVWPRHGNTAIGMSPTPLDVTIRVDGQRYPFADIIAYRGARHG